MFEGRNILIWGPPREGKTYSAFEDMLEALKAGIKCVHNFTLTDLFYDWCQTQRVESNLAEFVDWTKLSGARENPGEHIARVVCGEHGWRNSRMYFDECHEFFRMKDQDEHDTLETMCSQAAKMGNVNIFVTQYPGKMSKRIRDNLNFNVRCRNLSLRKLLRQNLPPVVDLQLRDDCNTTGKPQNHWSRNISAYRCRMYESLALVGGNIKDAGLVAPLPAMVKGSVFGFAGIILSLVVGFFLYTRIAAAKDQAKKIEGVTARQMHEFMSRLENMEKKPVPVVEGPREKTVRPVPVKVSPVDLQKRILSVVTEVQKKDESSPEKKIESSVVRAVGTIEAERVLAGMISARKFNPPAWWLKKIEKIAGSGLQETEAVK